MANLRAFQNVSQPQGARLQQIPVAPPAPSAAAGIAAIGSVLTPLVSAGMQASAENKKVEAQEAEGLALASLNDRLIAAQQAGQTDPKFNTATAQRRIYREFASANPQYAQAGLKVFNDATGIKAAGMSNEEEQRIAIQNAAWKDGFGHPNMPEDVNQRQLERYLQIQNQSSELDYQAKILANQEAKGRIKREQVRTQVLGTLQKVSFTAFEGQNDEITYLMDAVANGEISREDALAQVRMAKVRFGQQLNSFGELKNDADVIALVEPQQQLFDLAINHFEKDTELEAARRLKEITQLKAENAILADPKNAHAIATSELFGHAPGTSGFVSQVVSQLYAEGPKDIRALEGRDVDDLRTTINNMVGDPKASEEAVNIYNGINAHIGRNGEDYTDDEKFDVIKVLNQPEIWSKLSQEDKNAVVNTLEVHMVDTVDTTLQQAYQTQVLVPDFSGASSSTSGIGGATSMKPITDYATLSVDANGIRFNLIDSNVPRQVRVKVVELNKSLAQKVNPTLNVLAGATGGTPESVVNNYYPLPTFEKSVPRVAGESVAGRWWRETFEEPSTGVMQGVSEEDRQRRLVSEDPLGELLADQGLVQRPDQVTETEE